MPYPNEHSCRLKDPKGYKRFRRENNWRKHEGKRIDAIWGIKDDEEETTELQAMRMPTSDWTEKAARAYCKEQHGSFEPASKEEDSADCPECEAAFEPAAQAETYRCECLDCGHAFETESHCRDVKCPKCGGECRRVERPGPGQRQSAFSPDLDRVPAAACRLAAGAFELGDNGEGSKTAPVRILARTPGVVTHWFWGRTVHDLDGVIIEKERLPLDYVHDDNQILGYVNHHERTERGLEVSGALTPFGETDRAAEVLHKSRAGVPYEASIYFGGEGIEIEEVDEDETVEVNGGEFQGPGLVFRKWPLRGVAVCPYGADSRTVTELKGGQSFPFSLREKKEDEIMAGKDTEHAGEEASKAVESPEQQGKTQQTAEAPEAVEAETPQADEPGQGVESEREKVKAEIARFVEAFGPEKGHQWWSEGKSFEEAQALRAEELAAENKKLRQRIDQAELGDPEGVEHSTPEGEAPNARAEELKARGVSDGVALFAASLRFPDERN